LIELKDKIALITGATGDMGSTFATGLATAGADVILTSRSQGELAAIAAQIEATTGQRTRSIACDFMERESVAALCDSAWALFGRIDIVVNNAVPAGSQELGGDLLSAPEHTWYDYQRTIVWGPLQLAKSFAPRMAAIGGGCFVNIVSHAGIDPVPGLDAYGFAKGGLLLLTKYMAREWGEWGIRANAISPGMIAGPASVANGPEAQRILERTYLRRRGTKDEVVGAVVYLASDAARFVTGQMIAVNGGR